MKIRRVRIENFRGIESLDWRLDSQFVCLVGPGDSTKTTILDAIGYTLSGRYNLSFSDADFYSCNTSKPICIKVVVTDLPDQLVRENSQGKNLSGIRQNGNVIHDPLDEEGVEPCLIIRLTIDESLEPVWDVIRPKEEGGSRITASERARLGFFRVGEFADSHLRWGRGSALTGLTDSKSGASSAIVEAQRSARKAIADSSGTALHEAAELVKTSAVRLGSAPYAALTPGLDPRAGSGSASLLLHDNGIPLTNYGLGSRRLTSLAIQDLALGTRSIVAIDELEHGLDPHRLLHLVRHLRRQADDGQLQVFVTTHAPLVVEGLHTKELFVVRSDDGCTVVTPVPEQLEAAQADVVQGVMRERPSALLARRVIVGEGATETGFLRQMLWHWDSTRTELDDLTAVTAGVAVSNGAGDSKAPPRARAMAELGYPTLLVIDGDVSTNAELINEARSAGCVIVQWPSDQALEDAIVSSLPLDGLQELVELAVDEIGAESVLGSVSVRLEGSKLEAPDVPSWVGDYGEQQVRDALAAAAKGLKVNKSSKEEKKAWFKREDRAERLAQIVAGHINEMSGTSLVQGLETIHDFAYEAAGEVSGADDDE